MRYGTIPIVGRVGGLNDTIIDANPMALDSGVATGIQFSPVNSHMLYSAISRTFNLFKKTDHWNEIVKNCLNQNVGWSKSAQTYKDLYKSL
jgi:starch synthase